MDLDFRAQEDEANQAELLKLYRKLSSTYSGFSNRVPRWAQPRLIGRRKKLAAQIHAQLAAQVRSKFADLRAGAATKSRSVLSLSLHGVDSLSDDFVDGTCDQLKTFLFAGHDTTSILLQWSLYELSRCPRALRALRAELDAVFGAATTDPAAVAAALRAPGGEEKLRMLPYASAVIKETLRLHPPAGSARYVEPGTNFRVRTPDGDVCVDGMVLYLCASIIQRDPRVYGADADEFVPDRWLGDTDTTSGEGGAEEGEIGAGAGRQGGSGIPPSAWRPFERGPRNCIGQELANIEARVILALVARRFDFVKIGLGELEAGKDGEPVLGEDGNYKTKSTLFNVNLTLLRWLVERG
jgi:cytochrome P450